MFKKLLPSTFITLILFSSFNVFAHCEAIGDGGGGQICCTATANGMDCMDSLG